MRTRCDGGRMVEGGAVEGMMSREPLFGTLLCTLLRCVLAGGGASGSVAFVFDGVL